MRGQVTLCTYNYNPATKEIYSRAITIWVMTHDTLRCGIWPQGHA